MVHQSDLSDEKPATAGRWRIRLILLWFDDFVDITNRGKQLAAQSSNIIILYADDLGYGDLDVTVKGRENTPLRLAGSQRIKVYRCTLYSRYLHTVQGFSLLAGVYAFRNNAAILPGDAPPLIRPGTLSCLAYCSRPVIPPR